MQSYVRFYSHLLKKFCAKFVAIKTLICCLCSTFSCHCVKISECIFSGLHFPAFGLNIYSVNLRIQSTYEKIRTRKISYSVNFHAVEKSIIFNDGSIFTVVFFIHMWFYLKEGFIVDQDYTFWVQICQVTVKHVFKYF